MLQSNDPNEKIQGYLKMQQMIGPGYKREAAYYMSPDYQNQRKLQSGTQQAAQGQVDDQIALRTAQSEDTSKMTPEQKSAHEEKIYSLQTRLSGTDKGAEQSAQVRGMQSGLKAAGLSDEEIKKVISSHYGGAGMRGSSIQQKYADAVQEAIDKGQDPTNYPAAVELAKAIKAEHPPAERAVTLKTPDGKQVAGKVDHEGNLLLADNKPAPAGTMLYQQPNYASIAPQLQESKTVDLIGPDGIAHKMGWNPDTRDYDRDMGISSSGAYGHEMEQAGAVTRAGDDLIKDIKANKKALAGAKLGTLQAWVEKHGLNTPFVDDPELARLQAKIATFAALQPAMHGFRSRSAMESFETIIGGLQKDPDNMIASIEGIMGTAGAINPTFGKDKTSPDGGRGGKRKRNPSPPVDPNDPLGILPKNK